MSERAQHRLRVNPILCTGFGYCAGIVPELISLDDWGFPIVDARAIEDEGLLHLARRAAATCPQLALLVEAVEPARLAGQSTPS